MTGRLHDKVAIVTGAAGGIGEATAARFAAEGARVVACDIDTERVESTVSDVVAAGGDAVALSVDVTDDGAVERMVDHTVERWGRLDVLVNNAGVGSQADLATTTEDEWYRVLDTNLRGPFLCCQHSVPVMQQTGGGSIVNVASMSASIGIPGQAVYGPSKGGLLQMTRQLAVEHAAAGTRVNAVSPGTIDTPLVRAAIEVTPNADEILAFLLGNHPIGRMGFSDEVANAILFLASDEASFITGANLAVDGGYTAR